MLFDFLKWAFILYFKYSQVYKMSAQLGENMRSASINISYGVSTYLITLFWL